MIIFWDHDHVDFLSKCVNQANTILIPVNAYDKFHLKFPLIFIEEYFWKNYFNIPQFEDT